jgi:peptidoglycan/xylan/chitin deacetylase (PgdA/CDA1 family)
MSVTRGAFLKALGKSLPGLFADTPMGEATRKMLEKVAAVTGETPAPPPAAKTAAAKSAPPALSVAAPVIYSGRSDAPQVALTFDDGPMPGVTDRILDELKRRGLHATFFMLGERIAAAPELARRVVAEGHVVANHTYTHPRLTELPDARVAEEIDRTQAIMREVLGVTPTFFRPPFGALRPSHAALLAERGLRVVMWSVDPRDWSRPGEAEIVRGVLEEAQAGSIILCHDFDAQTASALSGILDGLNERGLSPVTLPELLT